MRERLIEIFKKTRYKVFPNGGIEFNLATQFTEFALNDIVDNLIENGVVALPCKLGDEIKGEIVHEIDYFESLMATGEIHISKKIYTCDKNDARKIILCSHPMSWEEAERALKGDEGK